MSLRVTIQREVIVPNPVKLARFANSPELGPKILFFSGGSALRKLSRHIIRYTHNSIHLITAFDSGGSSAVLRKAFNMLAIGDLRARLMDLADQTLHGNPEIYQLFTHRLPKEEDTATLCHELDRMVNGSHPLVKHVPDPLRKIIRNHLYWFQKRMPDSFELQGASIGNLILTGGYLENRRHPDPVIFIFSKLVEARGVVRPIVNKQLHLAARLKNGATVVGQHKLTGKKFQPVTDQIVSLCLVDDLKTAQPVAVDIRKKIKELIASAELICYPMGSFFTSIIANLLPTGVCEQIIQNKTPKVYVPNTGVDPECYGYDLAGQVRFLLNQLMAGNPDSAPGDVLNFVIVDSKNGQYTGGLDLEAVRELGVTVIDTPLISDQSTPYIDEHLLLPVLLSLV